MVKEWGGRGRVADGVPFDNLPWTTSREPLACASARAAKPLVCSCISSRSDSFALKGNHELLRSPNILLKCSFTSTFSTINSNYVNTIK